MTNHLKLELGRNEYPILEITMVENHPACNQYCVGINLNEAEADLDLEEATETENAQDVENVTDCTLNLVLEESFEDETGAMEPLQVVFVGKLPRLFIIQNIPVTRRRKNNKWQNTE